MVDELRSPAVPRAIAVLEEIAQRGPSIVADIADRRGLARSSAADVCAALEAEHLVSRDWQSRVVLGRTLSQIASGLTAGLPVLEAFAIVVERSAGLAGLTVGLDTLYCGEAMCVAVRHGRQSLPLTHRPGRRMALDASATGRALLLGATPEELRTHFVDFATMLTPTSGGYEAAALARDAAEGASEGGVVAMSSGYGYEVAAPVRSAERLIGAITLTLPDEAQTPASRPAVVALVRSVADMLAAAVDVTGR
jgi:DNA-binding IclR family transcriptional regulator